MKLFKEKKFVTLKKNSENGTEVRYNGSSIYIHINDKEKFDKHISRLHEQILNNLKSKEN